MIALAWFSAYWLRESLSNNYAFHSPYAIQALPIILVIQSLSAFAFGLYRGVWRFASIPDLIRIAKAVAVGIIISALVLFYINRLNGVPRSIFILYGMILILFLGAPRLAYRWIKDRGYLLTDVKRVLVVGAGQAAEGFVRDSLRDRHGYRVIAFVDDDVAKKGQEIHGIRVLGNINDVSKLVEKLVIDLIVIAIPSANSQEMRYIIEKCEGTGVSINTLPSISDIASGRVNINSLREVSIEDLLGRESVKLDWDKIQYGISSKKIVVTGGGGSIGSELCRQVANLGPALLVIIENSEFNVYELELELKSKYPNLNFVIYLASVTDQVAIHNIFKQHQPDIVFHAAAYKHVPILENQIRSALHNNLVGTTIVANEAVNCKVKKFVLISTDKAVNPTNIMGASKRAAEIFCQNYNRKSNTKFITTRFGNVLGSRGSVIPLFKQQLAQGGPITVTHPDITRYFMTIPEAVQLILQTTIMGEGGEIFVLDMGEPIKIRYLAEQLIRLSGKTPDQDIKIVYTGLRPGEKLHEELFYSEEKLIDTAHEKIHRAQYIEDNAERIESLVQEILTACEQLNNEKLYQLLKELVPNYNSQLEKLI